MSRRRASLIRRRWRRELLRTRAGGRGPWRCLRRARVFALLLRHVDRTHRGRPAAAGTLLRRGRIRRVKPAPVRLAPVYVPRIWGARSLAPLFDLPTGATAIGSEVPIGEVWLTGERCAFATGPFARQIARRGVADIVSGVDGSATAEMPRIPLLVKFIFPRRQTIAAGASWRRIRAPAQNRR